MKLPGKASVLVLALGVAATLSAGPGADGAQRFKDDLRFLSSKMLSAKYRLRRAAGGDDTLSDLQRRLDELRSLISRFDDLGGRIDSAESRLRYLKSYEVEPKMREVERVRISLGQRVANIDSRIDSVDGEIRRHNARKPADPAPPEVAGPYNAEATELDARMATLMAERQRIVAEAQRDFERAVALVSQAQREMADAGARHMKLAQEFADTAGQYGASRDPLARQLEQIENEPPATTGPFGSPSVSPGEARLVARPAPIGAGVSPRALDQLRVVTTTSRTAAGTLDSHYVPGQVDTRAVSGYVFDTNQGLPPADLPGVDAPEGVPVGESPPAKPEAAVPLEIEPSPTAKPDAPPALKNSPPVLQAEQKQAQLFGQLEQLYTERKQLAQQGGAASPTEWTNVVNKISETQAQINYTEAMKRMSGGSGVTDLTIRRKSRPLDAAVPPPDTKSP